MEAAQKPKFSGHGGTVKFGQFSFGYFSFFGKRKVKPSASGLPPHVNGTFKDPRNNPQIALARLGGNLSNVDPLDALQFTLGLAGMLPGAGNAFDIINVCISVARGNYGDAATYALAAIPIAGVAVGAYKAYKTWRTVRAAAKASSNAVKSSKEVMKHIFRDAPGHVNPSTGASQGRFIRLFENVGNNPLNLRQDLLSPQQINGGVQRYIQQYKNGEVWVDVWGGFIRNGGINR